MAEEKNLIEITHISNAAGQFFEADDGNQRGILQHRDEFIAERREDISYSLRQDDIVHGLPP